MENKVIDKKGNFLGFLKDVEEGYWVPVYEANSELIDSNKIPIKRILLNGKWIYEGKEKWEIKQEKEGKMKKISLAPVKGVFNNLTTLTKVELCDNGNIYCCFLVENASTNEISRLEHFLKKNSKSYPELIADYEGLGYEGFFRTARTFKTAQEFIEWRTNLIIQFKEIITQLRIEFERQCLEYLKLANIEEIKF